MSWTGSDDVCPRGFCKRKRTPGFKSCETCRAKARARHTKIVTDPDKGAELTKVRADYYARRKADPEWVKKSRAARRKSYVNLKRLVYSAYGGFKCACCGIDKEEFLSIDHITPIGVAGRRSAKHGTGNTFYQWLKRNGFPPGFRVLCHNCNFALGHYKYCPHKPQEGMQTAEHPKA